MKFKVENLPTRKIAFFRNAGPYGNEKNFEMMKEFKKWVRSNGLSINF